MKTKNFWIPYNFKERKPYFSKNFLYVPVHYDHHSAFDFNGVLKEVIPDSQPLYLEICSGNGQWILDRAEKFKNTYWIAVEKRFDRVRKIWKKMKDRNIKNLLIVFGDAREFVEHYLTLELVDKTFINFPDPWPKKRHEKHRLMQNPFIDHLAKKMKKNKELILVTDDAVYRDQAIDALLKSGGFYPHFPKPYFKTEWPDFGSSYFDALWREKGKNIHYISFKAQ